MKQMREISWDNCPNCGCSVVHVMSDPNLKEDWVQQDDEAICPDCGLTGYCDVDAEDCAYISWNEQESE